jgi:hypothetical protein
MNYTKFEKEIEQDVGKVTTKLISHILEKAYNKGYSDACNVYQKSIDLMGLRNAWDSAGRKKVKKDD